VTRGVLAAALALMLCPGAARPGGRSGQEQKGKQAEPVEPPEEDEGLREKQYSFNPLQASKELQVGSFYFKKGSWKAAAGRFEEAVKWNPGYADAWLRLGEAREKLKDGKAAKEAYAKFLELAPAHREAAEVRRKLAKLN
jgi:tetratricopeptide (TPR) repeat protein